MQPHKRVPSDAGGLHRIGGGHGDHSRGIGGHVNSFGDYNAIYGSVAGLVVLLLWLYISAGAMLMVVVQKPPVRDASVN